MDSVSTSFSAESGSASEVSDSSSSAEGEIILAMAASVSGDRLPSLTTTWVLDADDNSGGGLIRILEMEESGAGAGSSV